MCSDAKAKDVRPVNRHDTLASIRLFMRAYVHTWRHRSSPSIVAHRVAQPHHQHSCIHFSLSKLIYSRRDAAMKHLHILKVHRRTRRKTVGAAASFWLISILRHLYLLLPTSFRTGSCSTRHFFTAGETTRTRTTETRTTEAKRRIPATMETRGRWRRQFD